MMNQYGPMYQYDYTIQKVANGWILREPVGQGCALSGADTFVFESVAKIAEFIAGQHGESI